MFPCVSTIYLGSCVPMVIFAALIVKYGIPIIETCVPMFLPFTSICILTDVYCTPRAIYSILMVIISVPMDNVFSILQYTVSIQQTKMATSTHTWVRWQWAQLSRLMDTGLTERTKVSIYPEISLNLFPDANGQKFNYQCPKVSHNLKLQHLV